MAAGYEVGVMENLGVPGPVVGSIAWLGLSRPSRGALRTPLTNGGENKKDGEQDADETAGVGRHRRNIARSPQNEGATKHDPE